MKRTVRQEIAHIIWTITKQTLSPKDWAMLNFLLKKFEEKDVIAAAVATARRKPTNPLIYMNGILERAHRSTEMAKNIKDSLKDLTKIIGGR